MEEVLLNGCNVLTRPLRHIKCCTTGLLFSFLATCELNAPTPITKQRLAKEMRNGTLAKTKRFIESCTR